MRACVSLSLTRYTNELKCGQRRIYAVHLQKDHTSGAILSPSTLKKCFCRSLRSALARHRDEAHGNEENTWMTYRQSQDLGGQVRKGEKGALVVKYGTFTPTEREDDDERAVPYLKGYTVFNVGQIDNLPEQYYRPAEELPAKQVPHLDTVEAFVRNIGATVTYGGTIACYRPALDDILMPDRERFGSEVHLYSTLLHELAEAKNRLDRDLSGRFGSKAYAMEELVAELSAAFLCADLGVAHDPRGNTANYLENWLAVLKTDRRAIITAAAKAQAAADFLHKQQSAAAQ
ncbi:ArdC family protein [Sinorhizobium fredii]|uniref:ArdC family protein n=1 Tax=Rhizobium fredii TaxID=380 RepID=UPI003515A4E9